MAIRQRPDTWPKQASKLWDNPVSVISDEVFSALSCWKKPIKQRPDSWPKQARRIED